MGGCLDSREQHIFCILLGASCRISEGGRERSLKDILFPVWLTHHSEGFHERRGKGSALIWEEIQGGVSWCFRSGERFTNDE
jgi:hypothetical protein